MNTLHWTNIEADLDAHGCAVVKSVLTPDESTALAGLYTQDGRFRSRVVMARHGFGRGEYKYFAHPLPARVTKAPDDALRAPLARGESLERGDGDRRALPR